MDSLFLFGFALTFGHAAFGDLLPRVSYLKRGGLRFFRVGRFGATFYVSRGV